MLRKLALAIVTSGMMASSSVYALGMGEMELESSLNQPLAARIHLLSAEDLEDWEIKPALASQADFDQAGVERNFFLTNLNFEVIRQGGETYIEVSTKASVKEPFLNFLVEVDWPNGRLLREYTLLLDPPVFQEEHAQAAAPVTAPAAVQEEMAPESAPSDMGAPEEQNIAAEESAPADDMQPQTAAQEEVAADVAAEDVAPVVAVAPEVEPAQSSAREEYKVQKNDTLWEVAVRVRPNKSLSAQQTMLALQDLNPDAFIDNNINRLKRNQVLRVPTESEITRRSFNRAAVDVRRQNKEFAKYRGQLDATKQKSSASSVASTEGGELKLVAPGQATADKKQNVAGQVPADAAVNKASEDLSLALENLDKTKRDNAELQTRLKALEEQIATMQRLVSLKDEQLAAIQAGTAAPEVPADLQAKANAPVANVDLNFQETPAAATAEATAEEAKPAEAAQAEVKKPEVKKRDFFAAPEPEPEPDFISELIENPLYQLGGAALVLLLGALAFSRIRQAKAKKSEAADARDFAASDMSADTDDLNADFDHEFNDLDIAAADLDESEFDVPSLDDQADDLPDQLEDHSDVETTDVIGEAEIYIAYGRLDQARTQLENALLSDANRHDVRMKLLEVLAEQDDNEAFSEHFDVINQKGSAVQKADAKRMAANLTVAPSAAAVAAGAAIAADDDISLDLDQGDDLSMDMSSDLDFSLDDFDKPAPVVETAAKAPAGNELDFDLDFSIDEKATDDSSLELDAPVLSEETGSDENSLDFDTSSFDMDDNSLEFDAPVLDDSLNETADIELDTDSAAELEDLSFDLDDVKPQTSAAKNDFAELDSQMGELSAELDDLSLDLDAPAEELDMDDLAELDMSLDESTLDADLQDDALTAEIAFESDAEDTEQADSLDFDLDTDFESVELAAEPEADMAEEEFAEAELELPAAETAEPELAELGIDGLDEDLDFLSGTDECQTKLDLARAYIDMDDNEGAQEILREVLEEGNDNQKQEANKLLAGLA
ncbi:MAG: hypothetical protein H7A08_00825 [Oceanospirillaceae bacterium]|nr:hypothetical protein [Oceanospirillaceae bacterium]